jgi:RNA polymerase sigma factor (sigma-70 family)
MRGLHLRTKELMTNETIAGGSSHNSRLNSLESETPLARLLAQRGKFLGFLQRRVPDLAVAEDILQTGYLRALEHQDEIESGENATAWFYRLLRNAVVDNYRRQTTKDKALEAWAKELELEQQPSEELEQDICACLNDVVEGLKPEYAEVLRAVDLGEQRLQDFAHQQNLSTSNAGVRAHRARAALRRELIKTCGACAEHGCLDCKCKSRLGNPIDGQIAGR